jgi:hypothetical protein
LIFLFFLQSETFNHEKYEPHLERADSARLVSLNKPIRQNAIDAANAALANEPMLTDANDDEIQELTRGKENQGNTYISRSNSKPGLLPDAQTTALNSKLNLGLPDRGTFSDPHDGQKESPNSDKKPSISTQNDLPSANVFHKSLSGVETSSFDPISATGTQYSTAFIDQQVAKSIGKEQV